LIASPLAPKSWQGKPAFATCEYLSPILNLVANGQTPEAIIEDYPYLEPEDIQQSLQGGPNPE
jgi:uncharacterized protein (DUF433 family)